MKFFVNIFCLVVILQSCASAKKSKVELKLAFVVNRHGDRNILANSFPKNPYKKEKHWKGGFGALTKTGKLQGFELGIFLRNRYKKIIGKYYSSDKVACRSTKKSRTVKTAHCCLTGLFNKAKVKKNDIKCYPFKISITPTRDDYLLHPKAKCQRYDKLWNDYKKSRKVKDLLRKHRSLIKLIEKNTGKKVGGLKEISHVQDTLFVEKLKRYRLPSGLKEVLKSQKTLDYLVSYYYSAHTHSNEMKKLKGGYLIKDILYHFQRMAKSQPISKRRLYIYSTHDLTMVSTLNTLKMFDNKLPPYASSLHFELYKHGSSYYIQIFYRKHSAKVIKPLNIPNCGKKCSLQKFAKLYKDILPTKKFSSACKK